MGQEFFVLGIHVLLAPVTGGLWEEVPTKVRSAHITSTIMAI